MTGHAATGASKAVASSVLASAGVAYTVGTFRNAASWAPTSDFTTVGQSLATGINGFGKYAFSFAGTCTSGLGKTIQFVATPIINHPYVAARIAAYTGGIGACLYFACNEGIKAANANGILAKIGHASMATIGVAGACMVPLVLTPSALG